MMAKARIQPLDEKFAIVGTDGRPTNYFIRWAQQRQIDITQAISPDEALQIAQEYVATLQLQAGNGISLSPDGSLDSNPVISAQVQQILNQLSVAQGTILYRGAADWQVLDPGTPGRVLSTNGIGNDPSWIAQSGGGGGGGATYLSPTDAPPVNPSIYNDEFNDGSINGWTIVNSGAGLIFTEGDFGLIGEINTDTTQIRGLFKTIPVGATEFTISIGVNEFISKGGGFSGFSLGVTNGDTSSARFDGLTVFREGNVGGLTADIYYQTYNPLNNRISNTSYIDLGFSSPAAYIKIRVYLDAGVWKCQTFMSYLGLVYISIGSTQILNFIPTHMGISMYDRNGAGAKAVFRWFRVENII